MIFFFTRSGWLRIGQGDRWISGTSHLNVNMSVEFAGDMDIWCEVLPNVILCSGQTEADSGLVSEAADIVGDDLRCRAVQKSCEFIGHNPTGTLSNCKGKGEAVTLAIREFLRCSQHQGGFSETARREQPQGLLELQRECIDEKAFAEVEVLQGEDGLRAQVGWPRAG